MCGFKEVVPGVLVSENTKISVSHPDPCYVIHNPEQTASRMIDGGTLLVFSDEKKAGAFMNGEPEKSYIVKEYSWDDLVDRFTEQVEQVMVDHKGQSGFYSVVPLRKDI